MSAVVAAGLSVSGLLAAILFWRRAPGDMEGIGRSDDVAEGHLGRCIDWLRSEPPTHPSPPKTWRTHPSTPADRALSAIIRREHTDVSDMAEAHRLAARDHPVGVAGAFLRGRMGKAHRLAARRRYRGPPPLFGLWYVLIHSIRRRQRGIHLDAIQQALEETRT